MSKSWKRRHKWDVNTKEQNNMYGCKIFYSTFKKANRSIGELRTPLLHRSLAFVEVMRCLLYSALEFKLKKQVRFQWHGRSKSDTSLIRKCPRLKRVRRTILTWGIRERFHTRDSKQLCSTLDAVSDWNHNQCDIGLSKSWEKLQDECFQNIPHFRSIIANTTSMCLLHCEAQKMLLLFHWIVPCGPVSIKMLWPSKFQIMFAREHLNKDCNCLEHQALQHQGAKTQVMISGTLNVDTKHAFVFQAKWTDDSSLYFAGRTNLWMIPIHSTHTQVSTASWD